jgi:hypothetical protein
MLGRGRIRLGEKSLRIHARADPREGFAYVETAPNEQANGFV